MENWESDYLNDNEWMDWNAFGEVFTQKNNTCQELASELELMNEELTINCLGV